MKKLYCPWRSEYTVKTAHTKSDTSSSEECVFCQRIAQKNDAENFIIKRGKHNVVFLNKYPYNAGHILIMPYEHVAQLSQLSPQARTELMELLAQSEPIMRNTIGAHGVNMGVNLGKAAGAGIPSHLHFHVLPRWDGDTNFLPVLAGTKQISFDLHEFYKKIKKAFGD
jgi:ATP adenylyltransferase